MTALGGKEKLQHKVPAASLVPSLETLRTANMAEGRTKKSLFAGIVLCCQSPH